jgi:copper(I)-binding protein
MAPNRSPHPFHSIAIRLVCAAILLAATPALASDLVVANGRIPLPILDEPPSVHFAIQSKSAETRTIVGAHSPRCESIEIRRTAVVDGQWDSVPMPEGMPIPPGGAVAFAPRGLFLQLNGAEALAAGDSVPIVLELDGGEELAFDAVVQDD